MAQLAMGMLCVMYTALVTPFSIEREYVTPWCTLNSAYNEVTFSEKLAIMEENLHTKYTPIHL